MNITINYGTGNSITKNVPNGTTVGGVIGDANIKGVLGFGNNVEGFVGGVPQPATASLQDGDEISVHDKASTKAAA